MDGIVLTALVLKAVDYNENDKLVSLLTPDRGTILAALRGVKKATAKMKFAAQPFCFAEFVLSERSGRYVVTNCSEIESFYDLRTDLAKYYAASVVAEAAGVLSQENQADLPLFLSVVQALKSLRDGQTPALVLCRFLLSALQNAGFGLQLQVCAECGAKTTTPGMDYTRGGIVCAQCTTSETFFPSPAVWNALRMTDQTPADRLHTLRFQPAVLQGCLRILQGAFSYNVQPLKTLPEALRMLAENP